MYATFQTEWLDNNQTLFSWGEIEFQASVSPFSLDSTQLLYCLLVCESSALKITHPAISLVIFFSSPGSSPDQVVPFKDILSYCGLLYSGPFVNSNARAALLLIYRYHLTLASSLIFCRISCSCKRFSYAFSCHKLLNDY